MLASHLWPFNGTSVLKVVLLTIFYCLTISIGPSLQIQASTNFILATGADDPVFQAVRYFCAYALPAIMLIKYIIMTNWFSKKSAVRLMLWGFFVYIGLVELYQTYFPIDQALPPTFSSYVLNTFFMILAYSWKIYVGIFLVFQLINEVLRMESKATYAVVFAVSIPVMFLQGAVFTANTNLITEQYGISLTTIVLAAILILIAMYELISRLPRLEYTEAYPSGALKLNDGLLESVKKTFANRSMLYMLGFLSLAYTTLILGRIYLVELNSVFGNGFSSVTDSTLYIYSMLCSATIVYVLSILAPWSQFVASAIVVCFLFLAAVTSSAVFGRELLISNLLGAADSFQFMAILVLISREVFFREQSSDELSIKGRAMVLIVYKYLSVFAFYLISWIKADVIYLGGILLVSLFAWFAFTNLLRGEVSATNSDLADS